MGCPLDLHSVARQTSTVHGGASRRSLFVVPTWSGVTRMEERDMLGQWWT